MIRIAAMLIVLAGAAMAAPPQRVVSTNLCTDQLAMLLAAPGQLVSVSHIAADPLSSLMADRAGDYVLNHGRAEEIWMLRPDLVLAGPYTDPTTMRMVQGLGVRVEVLPIATDFDQVRAHIRQIGLVLGRDAAAEAMVARFDAALAGLPGPDPDGRLVATYEPNGYMTGSDSLATEVMLAAGLRPLSRELGRAHYGPLPLETLVLARPQILITGERYAGASQAEALLDHPALRDLGARQITVPGRDWICALPALADTARRLSEAAK